MSVRNAFEILGLEDSVSDTQIIRRAYKTQARLFHPDRAGSGRSQDFVAIKKAYEILQSPTDRVRLGRVPLFPDHLRRESSHPRELYTARACVEKIGGTDKGLLIECVV